jgi:hypothetical protein
MKPGSYALWVLAIESIVATQAFTQQAGGEIVARSAMCVVTARDMQDILEMDKAVLKTPLTPTETEAGRVRILGQFQSRPEGFCKSLPAAHKAAEIMRHGSWAEQTQLGVDLWNGWLLSSARDKASADWVAVVEQHNPPIVAADGLTVRDRQLNAMFASNDWVARAARLPASTPASRAAFVDALKSKFASFPREQKEWYAQADLRWLALQDPIMDHDDLRAKAVGMVQQAVHGPADVANEARALENEGLKFHAVMAKYTQRAAQIAGLAGDEMNTEALRNAKGPDVSVPPPHYPDPHTHH